MFNKYYDWFAHISQVPFYLSEKGFFLIFGSVVLINLWQNFWCVSQKCHQSKLIDVVFIALIDRQTCLSINEMSVYSSMFFILDSFLSDFEDLSCLEVIFD